MGEGEECIVVWMFFALALAIPEVFDLYFILSLDFCRNRSDRGLQHRWDHENCSNLGEPRQT